MNTELTAKLQDVYMDLHRHPELSHQEHRTAGIAANWLNDLGYEVVEGIGGTGVVGILRRGEGPTVLLRADMDGLPVTEQTGLSYSSENEGVMHACGHDMHVTCLMGAAQELKDSDDWNGTLVVLFQPAEETVTGAKAMIADGLYSQVPMPDVVLGQHVAPLPAGYIGLRSGPTFAASDSFRITMVGKGGHGSRPETTVDPVVMAASTVMRLQTIVSRETAANDMAVVTVGSLNAGTKPNIIPEKAVLKLSVRSYDEPVRTRIHESIERIVKAEASASGAPEEPTIELIESTQAVVNDVLATERVKAALDSVVGDSNVIDPGRLTGSEDVGALATEAGAPIVYWLLGGSDPKLFAGAKDKEELVRVLESLPSNHSPFYHPMMEPTIEIGVAALVAAAKDWLS